MRPQPKWGAGAGSHPEREHSSAQVWKTGHFPPAPSPSTRASPGAADTERSWGRTRKGLGAARNLFGLESVPSEKTAVLRAGGRAGRLGRAAFRSRATRPPWRAWGKSRAWQRRSVSKQPVSRCSREHTAPPAAAKGAGRSRQSSVGSGHTTEPQPSSDLVLRPFSHRWERVWLVATLPASETTGPAPAAMWSRGEPCAQLPTEPGLACISGMWPSTWLCPSQPGNCVSSQPGSVQPIPYQPCPTLVPTLGLSSLGRNEGPRVLEGGTAMPALLASHWTVRLLLGRLAPAQRGGGGTPAQGPLWLRQSQGLRP
nr:uncharacterized protein LOC123285621 [Equus asinus]